MAAQTYDALAPTVSAHGARIRLSAVAAVVAFGIAAVAALDAATPDRRILEVSTGAPGAAGSPADAAVAAWAGEHGDELFPGAGAYTGRCDAAGASGLCSAMTEDLGDTQVHTLGIASSDAGADVLVEQADAGWQVTAVAAWPGLGDRYDGAPWSPLTAITSWWLADERAATMYGEGAIHLRSCDEAASASADTGQPLLCSTLVEDAGTSRTYDTGLAGRPADARVTVVEQPDRTWVVTETLAR